MGGTSPSVDASAGRVRSGVPPPVASSSTGLRRASVKEVVLLSAGSATMAAGMVALYVASYWSYAVATLSTLPLTHPSPRTGLPVFTADQTVALALLAFVPLVALASSRWPLRLVARSAIVALLLSALASMWIVQPPRAGVLTTSGPLPAWSWLLAIPVVWAGGAAAWMGLGSLSRRSPPALGHWWGIPFEPVWAGVLGTVLVAAVLWPGQWMVVAATSTLAGLLLTLVGPAWRLSRRSSSG